MRLAEKLDWRAIVTYDFAVTGGLAAWSAFCQHASMIELALARTRLTQLVSASEHAASPLSAGTRFWSHVPKRETTNVHDSGQVCMFQGKNGPDSRAFTTHSSGTSSINVVTGTSSALAMRSNTKRSTCRRGSCHKRRTVLSPTSDLRDKVEILNPFCSAISLTLRRTGIP